MITSIVALLCVPILSILIQANIINKNEEFITICTIVTPYLLFPVYPITKFISFKYINYKFNEKSNKPIIDFLKYYENNINYFRVYPPKKFSKIKLYNYSKFNTESIENLDMKYKEFLKINKLINKKINL